MQPGPLPDIESQSTFALGETASEHATAAREPTLPDSQKDPLVPGDETSSTELAQPNAIGPGLHWRAAPEEHFARVKPHTESTSDTMDVPSPDAAQAREEALRQAPLAHVIASLSSSDRFESAIAESVLQDRGMSAIDLQIARRLHNADPRTRLGLLDEIARRPGASLVAWLKHFATDEAADVRHRALTLLATSGRTTLVEQVYTQAIRDSDSRIRVLAEQLEASQAISH
jgi:hypothetical protein